MKRFRIQLVIAFIVLVCGVSLIGLIYIISTKPVTYVTPGVLSAPSPVASPVQPVNTGLRLYNRTVHHVAYAPSSYSLYTPSVSMPSYQGLYLTSSAQVHSVGGGGNGGGGIALTSGGSANRGIVYTGSVTMPMTTFVAMAESRQVAQPEASEAPQMASVASAPERRAPGPPNIQYPPEEHQLVEHPLGDGLWVLLMLAVGYTVVRRNRMLGY